MTKRYREKHHDDCSEPNTKIPKTNGREDFLAFQKYVEEKFFTKNDDRPMGALEMMINIENGKYTKDMMLNITNNPTPIKNPKKSVYSVQSDKIKYYFVSQSGIKLKCPILSFSVVAFNRFFNTLSVEWSNRIFDWFIERYRVFLCDHLGVDFRILKVKI